MLRKVLHSVLYCAGLVRNVMTVRTHLLQIMGTSSEMGNRQTPNKHLAYNTANAQQ